MGRAGAIDTWLGEFLASGQGVNKLQKLGRAKAAERHVVIVLDPASQPGMGIPLGLSSRHDAGAAEYVMPSFEPLEPLTHLWLLPVVKDSEGLRWTRDIGVGRPRGVAASGGPASSPCSPAAERAFCGVGRQVWSRPPGSAELVDKQCIFGDLPGHGTVTLGHPLGGR
jgi:hypothetical protein